MDLTLTFFLFSIPAVVFAGISKGGFGSGAAFASAPMLAMIMPPELAIGLMLPLLMVIDFASLKFYFLVVFLVLVYVVSPVLCHYLLHWMILVFSLLLVKTVS